MSSTSKLSIIILSYNTRDLLQQTLNSLPTNQQWRIIVVDNNSSDDSVAMVKREYPQVEVIVNEKNIGFAAGNNVALRLNTSEYVVLLNSDTVVKPGAFERSLEFMDKHPEIGAMTPKILLPDGSLDIACHRGMPTPWRAFTYFSKLEKLFPTSTLFSGYHLGHLPLDRTHQVEATAATAMMIRSSVIDEIGLLDEQFFFYAEDLDYCKRITDAGYQIFYYPEATVIHYKSQSGKKKDNVEAKKQATAYFYQTMKQFYDKHYHDTYPRWMRTLIFTGIDILARLK